MFYWNAIQNVSITLLFFIIWSFSQRAVNGFVVSSTKRHNALEYSPFVSYWSTMTRSSSASALNVWWFGGSDNEQDDDSCELVAVRIERTSPNSRRIAGSIVIPKPVEDVWAILTDYDNLAIHVPNLVESKRVNPGATAGALAATRNNGLKPSGIPGDGSYRCRLFQKGAQKIVGFEFGASVTMDMTEQIVFKRTNDNNGLSTSGNFPLGMEIPNGINLNEEKKIIFKCVESQFFSEFDGEWKVSWTMDPDDPTKLASMVEYVVDVRPRGPVPVQALEWRIREDVPTNLRAVKAASIDLGREGVEALRNRQRRGRNGSVVVYKPISVPPPRPSRNTLARSAGRLSNIRGVANGRSGSEQSWNVPTASSSTKSNNKNVGAASATATTMRQTTRLAPVRVDWYEDETMATYLNNRSKTKKR